MKEQYNALNKKHNQFRTKLIADLQPYSDEIINKKPSPAAWSVADNIAHLIAAEEYVYNYVSKKIKENAPAAKTGMVAKVKRWVLKVAFATPLKFKVPKSVAPLIEYATLKQLESKWEKSSKAMHELLSSLDESHFYKDIWKHPRVGKINFVQMMDFAIEHEERHEKQIKRTLLEVGKDIPKKH